jgi:hypothetical protein
MLLDVIKDVDSLEKKSWIAWIAVILSLPSCVIHVHIDRIDGLLGSHPYCLISLFLLLAMKYVPYVTSQ